MIRRMDRLYLAILACVICLTSGFVVGIIAAPYAQDGNAKLYAGELMYRVNLDYESKLAALQLVHMRRVQRLEARIRQLGGEPPEEGQ